MNKEGPYTVTDLKWRSAQPGRVWIYLDDHAWASVGLVAAARFKVGDRIDEETATRLKVNHHRHDAYRCALRLLGRRNHSGLEIRRKLKYRDFEPDAIDHALNRLTENKYLNDQAFAIEWVNYRMNNAPRSRRLMAQELRHKGINEAQIDAALVHVDELALAKACIQRQRRRWQRLAEPMRRLKMLTHLNNKGFSYAISQAAVANEHDLSD